MLTESLLRERGEISHGFKVAFIRRSAGYLSPLQGMRRWRLGVNSLALHNREQDFYKDIAFGLCATDASAKDPHLHTIRTITSIRRQPAYATCELRMSESPASRMAMVEQRKSFPQAVPSSIYMESQYVDFPPKPTARWTWEASSQGS